MGTLTTERRDGIFVIDFGDDENRTSPDWVAAIDAALDEIDGAAGPKGVVLTGRGRIFSNGLDVEWMAANRDGTPQYLQAVQAVLARLLEYPAPTAAAVNGHAFGLGAFLTIAVDQVVMREDRGFVCWPEAPLGMPFTPGLMALAESRLTRPIVHRALMTGHRFPAPEAVAAGIVDVAAPADEVLDATLALVRSRRDHPQENLTTIRAHLHDDAIALLRS